jgi:hypothetical protein
VRGLIFAITAVVACGQDVSVTLATEGGRTSFPMGEAIPVELRFQSSVPGRYVVDGSFTERSYTKPEFEQFTIEPADGVVDPMAEWPALSAAGMNGASPRYTIDRPVVIRLRLNGFVSFRKPGWYRVSVETTRVMKFPALRSNTIEIELTNPEEGWAEARLEWATKKLESSDTSEQSEGARALRDLETPEAARVLARSHMHGFPGPQAETGAALRASPFKNEAVRVYDELITEPGIAVGLYELYDAIALAAVARHADLRQVEAEYFAKLRSALPLKTGQARAVAIETLARGPQPGTDANKSLVENFAALPESSQARLLDSDWPRIALPEMEPLVRSLAEGSGGLRDAALKRLRELNPQAARKITLDRIRRRDVLGSLDMYRDYRVLQELPDLTLPEMDGALTEALEAGKHVEPLIARYASSAAASRVRAWLEKNPRAFCYSGIAAYFFRVDPDWAEVALARAKESGGGPCVLQFGSVEDLVMSPGLERQALRDISSPDVSTRITAAGLLQIAGSSAVKQPLMDAFVNAGRADQDFLNALLAANAWLATPELFDWVARNCSTDECKRMTASIRRAAEKPPEIHWVWMGNPTYVQMGLTTLRSRKQLEGKIAQYPKGSEFVFPKYASATWYDRERAREIREILEAAGMRLLVP